MTDETDKLLCESEARYRSLFNAMNEGFAIHELVYDVKGEPCDYRFLDVNPAFERLTGLKHKDVVGNLASQVLPNNDPYWLKNFAEVALTGKAIHFENYSAALDRYYEVYASCPKRGQFSVLFAETTERRRMEIGLQKAKEELEQRVAERTAELQAAHQSLVEESRYLEAFFRHSITPLVFLDRNFNFIRVNEAYAKADQKRVDEFPGHNHFEFYPSDAQAIFEEVVRTRKPFQVVARPFIYPDHPDWGVTYWDWTLTPLLDERGEVEVLVFALEDVTVRKQAEVELEKHREHLEELVRERTRELEGVNAQLQAEISERQRAEEQLFQLNLTLRALSKSNQALMRATEETAYLQEVCKIVVEDCDHAMVWIGYAEEDKAKSVRPVAYAGFEENYLEKLKITWADTKRGRGPTGTAIRTGKPCVCRNILTDPNFAPWREQAVKRGYASSIVLPLLDGGKVFGAINIYSRQPDPFADDKVKLLTELANDLAYGITSLRLRAAHALAESKLAYLASFPEMNPNPIMEVDLDGRIRYVNPAALDLFPDLRKQELAHPWLSDWAEVVRPFIKGETETGTRDVTIDERSYQQALYYSAQDRFVRIYGFDITKRKRAEEALYESELHLRLALEGAGGGMMFRDSDGIWQFTPQINVLLGRSAEDPLIQENQFLSLVHPEELVHLKKSWRDAIERDGSFEQEYRIFWPDGSLHWLVSKGKISTTTGGRPRFMGITYDITERKRAEEALRESERRWATTLASIGDAVIATDMEGRITFMNAVAKALTGWMWGEAAGKPVEEVFNIINETTRQQVDSPVAKVIREGTIVGLANHTILVRKDGTEAPIDDSGAPIRGQDSLTTGVVLVFRDITERKQLEEELLTTRTHLEKLINYANAPIIVWDPNFKITRFNHAFERLTGLNADEVINQPLAILFPENSRTESLAFIERTSTGEHWDVVEIPILRTDGSIRTVLWNSANISDQDGTTVIATIAQGQDITERKQAEEALQAKQEELTSVNEELQAQTAELNSAYQELERQAEEIWEYAKAAVETRDEAERRAAELDATLASIAVGIIIYDNSGKIVRINETARKLLGYSGEYYNDSPGVFGVGSSMYKSDGGLYELEEMPLYRALRGEIIQDEEFILNRAPDKPIWLSSTVAPIYNSNEIIIGVVTIVTDITERKRQVEDLLASERELLKVTLNSIGEGVVASDQEGRVIFINEAAANLIGYSQEEAIGKPLTDVFYILNDETSEPIIVTAAQRMFKQPVLVTRDLREVPIAMNCSPIKANDGGIIGTVTVFQDITEKQRTEQELLKTEKLESLGILAGGIAHDFNNVLAAILANIQLATIKLAKSEDIKPYLLNTTETTRKASELTKQLLTFARGGAPVKKDASLIELIKDTTEFVLRGSNIKAKFAVPDDLWAASIDEGQISQVIHNLVINAKQAMLKGGVINISAANILIGEDTRFSPGKYVKITVQDHGTGISKENMAKIFDPFFTTKKDGNGLGLATSYSIISKHNGYIELESQEGVGTTFFIYLPASKIMVVPTESEKEIAAVKAGLKILLMDDEEKILNAIGELLHSNFGYQVVLATDGAAAIELYKKAQVSGGPFDAVIMDLTIPGGMGGQETIAHLRDFDPKIKAIVSSGYANDPIMADYERYGFCGVVSKPYKINELNEILHKIIVSA